jgi:molybdopterin molybdotransferase
MSDAFAQSGTAYRIMTGAPVPAGADAVIRFEETSVSGNVVAIHRRVQPNENIRMAGEDIAAGDIAIPAGARIRPQEIGVLASIGALHVNVHRRPRVGVLSTGDEITEPGIELLPGMIRDANLPMIAAAVRQAGGDAIELGVVRDSEDELRRRFADLPDLDLLIVTGGVSVGDFDLVKQVMHAEGEISLWQVRMKPGKPLAFGKIAGVDVIGLPGNPVAALVAFHQFARASILTMLGRQDLEIPTVNARLVEPVENRGRRRHFVRGIIKREEDEFHFHPSGVHGSAMLRAAASSNCYLIVPESVDHMDAGDVGIVQLPDEGL